jgi:hypothetical protein
MGRILHRGYKAVNTKIRIHKFLFKTKARRDLKNPSGPASIANSRESPIQSVRFVNVSFLKFLFARMAEQADAADSKSAEGNLMGVRFPLRAPCIYQYLHAPHPPRSALYPVVARTAWTPKPLSHPPYPKGARGSCRGSLHGSRAWIHCPRPYPGSGKYP